MMIYLPLKKTLQLYKLVIGVRSVFHVDNKNHVQVCLVECLHK